MQTEASVSYTHLDVYKRQDRYPELIGLYISDIPKVLPNMLIVGISRNGKVIIPHGNTQIGEDDWLYVMGEKGPILDLNAQVHEKGKYTDRCV